MRITTLMLFAAASAVIATTVTAFGDNGAGSSSASDGDCRYYESGRWRIWQTGNFRVCTLDPDLRLSELPAKCEELKVQVESAWFKGSESQSWRPRCDVIVHKSLRDYQRALGQGVGNSVGCATMQYDSGRVVSRRVDIRVDADEWQVDALPHELTHVVLAAGLGNRRLPPWLDEGVGVLSESLVKRTRRAAAYRKARARHTVYSTSELIRLRTFPRPEYRDAFYVQSAALVRLLHNRGGPERFARFARRALNSSVDRSLRETYQIAGIAELERIARADETSQLVMKGALPAPPEIFVADADE